MKEIKKLIARNFESFAYFYRHLRYRVFLVVGISILVGLLDGFGLSMFLPLLHMVDDSSQADPEGMGNMAFLVEGMQAIGLDMDLLSVLLVIVVFFMLKGFAVFANSAYRAVVQQYFIRKVRMQLLGAFNRIRFKYYVTSDVGRIQNTMSGEVDRVAKAFRDYFQTVEQGVLVAVYILLAFFVDARFALLVTLGGALTNILYSVFYRRTKRASKKFTSESHGYQGQIIQHVANFKYLKATGLLKIYASKLRATIEEIEQIRRKIGIINATLMGVREPLMILIVAAVILVQTLVLNAPLGPILLSLLFFYRALSSLMQMQKSWNRFLEVSGSLENTQDFQRELQVNRENAGQEEFVKFNNSLELKGVDFSYGTERVLSGINLHISKNETIAFVGESGSGKTTLVNILAALMPVDSGDLYVDSRPLGTINPASYQARIGYITQEPVIFNDSIFNNVTFWAAPTEENRRRFEIALEEAAILDFVHSLSMGADTLLGNNGVNLSGGQKQRISIARELYKDIDILIMDEATSALDTETEKAIQDSIDALKGQYTILIVAHRLSTIKSSDRIVLMRNGRIESVASYPQLIAENLNFQKMVELQDL